MRSFRLAEDVRKQLGEEVAGWIEGYAVSAPDVESGDETPADVAEGMVGIFERHAHRAAAEARAETARLRVEVQRLMACEAAFSEWDRLSRAPLGKYDGPSVLRARDRLQAALTAASVHQEER